MGTLAGQAAPREGGLMNRSLPELQSAAIAFQVRYFGWRYFLHGGGE